MIGALLNLVYVFVGLIVIGAALVVWRDPYYSRQFHRASGQYRLGTALVAGGFMGIGVCVCAWGLVSAWEVLT